MNDRNDFHFHFENKTFKYAMALKNREQIVNGFCLFSQVSVSYSRLTFHGPASFNLLFRHAITWAAGENIYALVNSEQETNESPGGCTA